jgi:hypothetical protein
MQAHFANPEIEKAVLAVFRADREQLQHARQTLSSIPSVINQDRLPYAPFQVCAITSTDTPRIPVSNLFYDMATGGA